MASEIRNNRKFHNWVKTSLALLLLKTGVADEITKTASDLHDKIKKDVNLICPHAATSTCKCCNSKCVEIKYRKTGWKINCASNVCNHWLDQLIQYHEHLPCPDVKWANCDPTLWPSRPWEVAKVFQPIGCAAHENAKDSDIAALLTFMLNCTFFDNGILPNKRTTLREIKTIRNGIMHSATLEVEDNDMITWLDKIIALLEDPTHFLRLPACKTAADKIRELKTKSMEILFGQEEIEAAVSHLCDSLRVELLSLRQDFNEMKGEMHGIISPQGLDEMKQNICTNSTEISQLKARVETLQTCLKFLNIPQSDNKFTELTGQLDGLSQRHGELRTEFDESLERIRKLESDMDNVKSELSNVQQQLHTKRENRKFSDHLLKYQQERRELNITEGGVIKSQIPVRQMSRDYEERINVKQLDGETRREFTHGDEKGMHNEEDIVRGTQKLLMSVYNTNRQKVPIYPLIPEWRENVEQLYVKPSMEEMNPRGLRISTEKISNTTEAKVKNLRDIFYSGEKSYRDIYLVAESGSGKSTLCEYLVYLWVKEHSKTKCGRGEQGDEGLMKEFVLLFYISLREANNQAMCDIEEMIRSQLELQNVDVSKLIVGNKCLIILDGLDEYSQKHLKNTQNVSASLPWRRRSDNCTVLTTSRPWKMELVASELGDKITRQIRIIGLEMESQVKLVENVITLLNSKNGQNKDFKAFFDDMSKQRLEKNMETPILLMQMVGLWFDGESFGNSQCEIYSKIIEKQIQFAAEVRGVTVPSSKEEHNSAQLPHFFRDQRYCQLYQGLLLKLSKLAYGHLFGSQESALVFDHDHMECMGLSEDEIQSALHLGLLTQYKVLGKITQRQKSISFVHKSHQEFFAAIYLWQTGLGLDLQQLLDGFTDLDRALQVEKVCTFVSGMNPHISALIAEVIMTQSSRDSRIEEYRGSCSDVAPHEALVQQIQGVILAAIEESVSNNIGNAMPSILLQDLWMKRGHRHFPPSRILACKQSLQLSQVKSMFINAPSDISRGVLWQLIKDSSLNLNKLVLFGCDITVLLIQKVVERNRDTLQAMGLYHDTDNALDFTLLDDSALAMLLPRRSLALDGVNLTHDQLRIFYKLLGQKAYGEVMLANINCNLHGDSCKPRLDLSANLGLHRLELYNLPVQDVAFVPDSLVRCEIGSLSDTVAAKIIHNLRNASRLEEIVCQRVEGTAIVELVRLLPQFVTLRSLVLLNIDLRGHNQVVLHSLKSLEEIGLYTVTLTAKQLGQILADLPSRKVFVVLGHNDYNWPVTITNYDSNDNIIEQTAASPDTEVDTKKGVTFGDDTCVVECFMFYHKK